MKIKVFLYNLKLLSLKTLIKQLSSIFLYCHAIDKSFKLKFNFVLKINKKNMCFENLEEFIKFRRNLQKPFGYPISKNFTH